MQKKQQITPFWNRIPAFFLYALRPIPLSLTIGLSIITAFTGSSVWSLVIYAVMMKYCFEALDRTTQGELSPPGLTYSVIVDGYELPAKLFALFVVFFMLVGSIGQSVGFLPSMILLYFGMFAMPASIMTLTVTNSMLSTLNPLLLMSMIRRIGWSYLILYAFLFFLSTAQATAQYFFSTRIDPSLFFPVYNGINLYFSIIMFHMMGYVIFQYHENFGEPTPAVLTSVDPETQKLSYFEQCMDEGNTDAAIAELQGLLKLEPNNTDLRQRLHTLLLANQRTDDLARHAKRYIPLLISNNNPHAAAEVYLDCLENDKECSLQDPESYHPLVQALRERHKPDLAVQLAKDFYAKFPDNDLLPAIYLLAAKILCEDLNRDDLARKILEALNRRFAQHELAPQINSYLLTIQQLSSA